jgi:hypothetical protein
MPQLPGSRIAVSRQLRSPPRCTEDSPRSEAWDWAAHRRLRKWTAQQGGVRTAHSVTQGTSCPSRKRGCVPGRNPGTAKPTPSGYHPTWHVLAADLVRCQPRAGRKGSCLARAAAGGLWSLVSGTLSTSKIVAQSRSARLVETPIEGAFIPGRDEKVPRHAVATLPGPPPVSPPVPTVDSRLPRSSAIHRRPLKQGLMRLGVLPHSVCLLTVSIRRILVSTPTTKLA